MATAAIFQLQKKQEAQFVCSACGADRACDCNAPAIERLAQKQENERRASKAYRERKHEEKQQPRHMTTSQPRSVEYTPCADCDTAEDFWQRAIMNAAGEAIAITDSATWENRYGDWSQFEITSELVTLAEQAAEAWKQAASRLLEMKK